MRYEVEMKFRVEDPAVLIARLRDLGASGGTEISQVDAYLAHPGRDFAHTGEALRVRQDGSETRITYKGPKLAGPTKTREEIEVAIADGTEGREPITRLFDRLGFRTVAEICKHRTSFHLENQGHSAEIVLDQVDDLGWFAEVETIAADESALPAAQAAVLALAGAIGLTAVEPRSYLRMWLQRQGIVADPSSRK